MDVRRLDIPEVRLITPRRFDDGRGFFTESYSARALADVGVALVFVQDNLSYSRDAGTLRGLHYQSPPHAQAKLVSVITGRVLDVAVDVRAGSPTFGRHVTAELSAETGAQLLVPEGFLHGFLTLEPETRVAYKVTDVYAPECDGAVRWDDPDLAIDWRAPAQVRLSAKDAAAPAFADFSTPFRYVAETRA